MNDVIFDSAAGQKFRRRAFKSAAALPLGAPRPDFLLARAAQDLTERLAATNRRFVRALDIFSHTDLSAQALAAGGKADHIKRVESLPEYIKNSAFPGQIADAENWQPQEQADLITSLLSLHSVNDLPGFLARIRRGLKPDGLFLAALAGAGTLGELRESLAQAETELYGGISPHIAPFIDIRAAGALLQRAGFALPVADTENLTARYADMFALMRDLRHMGAQNALLARRRKPFARRFFLRAAEIYAERFSDADGRIRATFSFIWLSGWAPHEGQQKPARRGSGQTPLAEALAGALPPKARK